MRIRRQSSKRPPQTSPCAHRRIPNYENPNELATRSRIHRKRERWHGLEEGSRLAEITVLAYGGINRPIITRGGKHLRSRLASRKTGLQQITEGRGHRDLAKCNEVFPQVLDYQAHPFLFRFNSNGQAEDYYPDHIRLMRDGTIQLIEVKRGPRDLCKPGYLAKMDAMREIAGRIGWEFIILFHDDITGPIWRMRNVEVVYQRRFMHVSRTEQAEIGMFVATGEPTSWAELRERLAPGDPRRGNAVIENAIALGRVDVNFDEKIEDETVVTPLAPVAGVGSIRI